ncbi:hypothetical protein ACHAXA_011417 [Cyclostephanos tholiformis]|uniref:Uncharacterized protein n=1 Tax=Cyclostephanos tholiformis TaxID=382380 RepID=A0ABD3RV52_9STRA
MPRQSRPTRGEREGGGRGGGKRRSRGRWNNGNVCDAMRTIGQRVSHYLADARVTELSEYDTIYVSFPAIKGFVRDVLPNLTANVIIISGHPFNVRPASDEDVRALLDCPCVLAWFCQNLSVYGGMDPYHIKVHPFPYGLNEKMNKLGLSILPAYKRVLFDGLNNNVTTTRSSNSSSGVNAITAATSTISATTPPNEGEEKDDRPTFVYVGPLKKVDHRGRSSDGVGGGGRENVPGSDVDRIPPHDYFVNMSHSRYVLSPNGDRPECHRHYEALGLGTVPITELDPILFRHLAGGPVVYANREWNATALERVLDPRPIVNRNLIREDYWMGWMEDVVGRRLNWNDP